MPTAVLDRIQGMVQRTYEVDTPYRAADFVTSNRALLEILGLAPADEGPVERVLVAEHDEGMDLSVYLGEHILEHLRDDNPLEALHDGNLESFWTVLEGISHFVYLVWNAGHGKPVTRLELELQAEVDKFVLTAALASSQNGGTVSSSLHRWLFDLAEVDERLGEAEQERYRTANRYAGRYCTSLMRRFVQAGRDRHLLSELRRFYRLSQAGKLRRIDTA